jgi:hypothetical protein
MWRIINGLMTNPNPKTWTSSCICN